MVATLPATGKATWTDRVDNWRSLDTDWIQDRLVLRYAAPPSPAITGGTYYDTVENRLRVQTPTGVHEVVSGLNFLVSPGAGADTSVTLGHKGAAGSGLAFTTTKLVAKQPLATSGDEVVIDSTGISIRTSGLVATKLTATTAGLISDKQITAPAFLGNVVATATTDAKALTATSGTFTSNVTVSGSLTSAGALTVGPARAYGRTDVPAEARFTHKDVPEGSVGWCVNSLGDLSAILAAGRIFYVWNKNPAGGHDLRMQVHSGGMAVQSGGTFQDSVSINAPSGQCLVLQSAATAKPYASWWHGGSRYGYMQIDGTIGCMNIATDPNWQIRLMPGGVVKMTVLPDQVSAYCKVFSEHNPIDGVWNNSNFLAYNNGSHGARMSFFHYGSACQLRYGTSGDLLEVINSNSTGHTRFMCYTVTQVSSLATKKDVRPLRPEHSSRVATQQLDPESDTVDAPDVMALRAVVYRSKIEPTKLTLGKDGQPDGGTKPWPKTEVFGREARRESLGLIADEVQHVLPSAVIHSPQGKPLGIDYSQVTVALLDHVQQLTERIEALESTA